MKNITEKEYKEALDLCQKYLEQVATQVKQVSKLKNEDMLLNDFVRKISSRRRHLGFPLVKNHTRIYNWLNIYVDGSHKRYFFEKVEKLKDLDKRKFCCIQGLGKGTWNDFLKLKEIVLNSTN